MSYQFSRATETVEVRGNSIVMQELSALEMQTVMAIQDEHEQAMKLLLLSLESQPGGGIAELEAWPTSVTNQLLAVAMQLNALTDSSGN